MAPTRRLFRGPLCGPGVRVIRVTGFRLVVRVRVHWHRVCGHYDPFVVGQMHQQVELLHGLPAMRVTLTVWDFCKFFQRSSSSVLAVRWWLTLIFSACAVILASKKKVSGDSGAGSDSVGSGLP
eukprot:351840-Rhodomonas_salina.1